MTVALVALPPQKNYKGFPVEHKLNRSVACIHVAMPFGVREKVKDCCTTTNGMDSSSPDSDVAHD